MKDGRHGATKSKRINVWDFSLEVGLKGEEIVRDKLESFITKVNLKRFDYNLFPEIQKEGIDQLAELEKASFDVKTRLFYAFQYNDILLELKTGDKLGWFYTSKADYIAYVIFNRQKTDLVTGYLIAIHNPRLREFVDKNLDIYSHKTAYSENKGQRWVTDNLAIPISDFPKGTLFNFIAPRGRGWGSHKKLNNFFKKEVNDS